MVADAAAVAISSSPTPFVPCSAPVVFRRQALQGRHADPEQLGVTGVFAASMGTFGAAM